MTYSDPNYPNHRYSYVDQYRERPFTHSSHLQPHSISVKVEDVDSPDLLPVPHHSHSQYSQHQQNPSFYRFGGSGPSSSISSPSPSTPVTPFTFMSGQTWPSSSSHSASVSGPSFQHQQQQQQQQYPTNRLHGYPIHASQDSYAHHSHVLPPIHDDYDDVDEDGLGDLPSGVSLTGYGSSGMDGSGNGMQGMGKAGEKQVRRRSSKACDQCRKSKCKCERSTPQEPCKNCVLLGTGEPPFFGVCGARLSVVPSPLVSPPYSCVTQPARSLVLHGSVDLRKAISMRLRRDYIKRRRSLVFYSLARIAEPRLFWKISVR